MQHTARIIDRFGQPGRLKIKRIREHEKAREGKWVGGVFVFTRCQEAERPRCKPVQSPTVGRIVSRIVGEFSGSDSGFSLLRYPPPSEGNGPKYRAFARYGGGVR